MTIKIANKIIFEKSPVFIIAEAGVNHNGRLDLALKLIDAAKEAGADAIKFQTFTAKNLATKDTGIADYAVKNLGKKESMVEMVKKLELDQADFSKLKDYCDAKGIIFLSTPHTFDAIDFLDSLMPAYKISSGDLTNLPFIAKIAVKNKPIILSTGMATLAEVAEAVDVIKKMGNEQIILLHCTTSYPCEPQDVNLRAMQTLQTEFNLPRGYSDHTLGIDAAKLAVKLGAVIIEKHFTLDVNLPGPDHKASLEPRQLKEMVKAIRNKDDNISIDKGLLLGKATKQPTAKEIEIAKIARKSLVASKDIEQGTVITKDMLTIKRPGTGLAPKMYKAILGRQAKCDIKFDSLIKQSDI